MISAVQLCLKIAVGTLKNPLRAGENQERTLRRSAIGGRTGRVTKHLRSYWLYPDGHTRRVCTMGSFCGELFSVFTKLHLRVCSKNGGFEVTDCFLPSIMFNYLSDTLFQYLKV